VAGSFVSGLLGEWFNVWLAYYLKVPGGGGGEEGRLPLFEGRLSYLGIRRSGSGQPTNPTHLGLGPEHIIS
jgi:hypothetical protein